MNQAFYTLSRGLGMSRLFESINRRRPLVLAFHGVTTDSQSGIYNSDGSHLDQQVFRQLIAWASRRYRIVPLLDIARWFDGEAALPDRALAITFDDGYRDVLLHAVPVLREFNAPATVFVTTDFVMERRSLWPDRLLCALGASSVKTLELEWDGRAARYPLSTGADRLRANAELRELLKKMPDGEKNDRIVGIMDKLGVAAVDPWDVWDGFAPLRESELPLLLESGVDVGSHTCTHPIVSQCTPGQIDDEARRSKRLIERATGATCTSFAYPNGAVGDFNDTTRRHLADAGYRCAVTTLKRHVTRDADRFEIPRMMLTHPGFTMNEFAVETSGFPAALRQARSGWSTR